MYSQIYKSGHVGLILFLFSELDIGLWAFVEKIISIYI